MTVDGRPGGTCGVGHRFHVEGGDPRIEDELTGGSDYPLPGGFTAGGAHETLL